MDEVLKGKKPKFSISYDGILRLEKNRGSFRDYREINVPNN